MTLQRKFHVKIQLAISGLLLVSPANGCINVDGTTIDGGSRNYGGKAAIVSLEAALGESPQIKWARILMKHAPGSEEVDGVGEIFSGNYDRAIEILKGVEATRPGLYGTAANLGTAYELQGDLEMAKKWIAEGIHRNPESHQGTEWLHLAIIDARMHLKNDPEYLDHHSVIELPDTFTPGTLLEVDQNSYNPKGVAGAIIYQLRERMVFVKPPDPVVANLLYTLGVLTAHTSVLDTAIPILNFSRRYGFQDSAKLDRTIADYERTLFRARTRKALFYAVIGMASIGFLIIAYRRKWFFLSRSAHLKHLESQAKSA